MKLKRILAIMFAFLMIFAFGIGCSKNKNNGGTGEVPLPPERPGQNGEKPAIPLQPVEDTDYKLLDNGSSAYRIVIGANATANEQYSAQELSLYFENATAVTLPIVTDSSVKYAQNSRLIVIGNTSLSAAAGLTVNTSDLGRSGVRLNTVDSNVFINGGTGDGIIYGAYEFMRYTIGFEVYAEDEIAFNAYNPNVAVPAFNNLTVLPAVDSRCLGYRELYSNLNYSKLMRVETFENSNDWLYIGDWCHNSMHLMPYATYGAAHPEWFNDTHTQLCFNQEAMCQEAIKQYLALLEVNKTQKQGIFGIMDNYDNCTCEKCSKDPTPSYAVVKFGNRLAKAIKEAFPDREYTLYVFAYNNYEDAPVKKDANGNWVAVEDNLITEDNLGIMMCTYHEYYEYPLSHAENVNYQNTMEGWAAIAKKMCVWHYGVNFDDELIVYNNFNTMKPDYEYIASLGVNAFFEQASNRTNTATFSELKIYLQSKLIWDPTVDVNALMNAFMTNYYKDAGTLMGEYLDELRAQYAYMATELGKLNSIRGTVASKEYFPHGMLKNWLNKFDEMQNAIAHYEQTDSALYKTLTDRVRKQSIPVRYMIIKIYGNDYSDAALLKMKQDFRKDCEYYNLTESAESVNITTLWETWGIA